MRGTWGTAGVVLFALSLLLCGPARGATLLPDVIEVTESSVLRWNFDSPTDVYSRFAGTSLFGDMTKLPDGRFVAYRTTYGGSTPALFQINPADGSASLLVQSSGGAGEVVALAPMRNGNLLGCDNTLGFVGINPATLAYTKIPLTPSVPVNGMFTGGMATSPSGDIYAWSSGFNVGGGGVYARLFKLDPDAGTATAIGAGYTNLRGSEGVSAMAFSPDGRLFAFTEINGGANGDPLLPNSIYELNLTTGLPTWLAQRNELADVRGIAFVPEPAASLVLLLIPPILRRRRPPRTIPAASPTRPRC